MSMPRVRVSHVTAAAIRFSGSICCRRQKRHLVPYDNYRNKQLSIEKHWFKERLSLPGVMVCSATDDSLLFDGQTNLTSRNPRRSPLDVASSTKTVLGIKKS